MLFALGVLTVPDSSPVLMHGSTIFARGSPTSNSQVSQVWAIPTATLAKAFQQHPSSMLVVVQFLLARLAPVIATLQKHFGLANVFLQTGEPLEGGFGVDFDRVYDLAAEDKGSSPSGSNGLNSETENNGGEIVIVQQHHSPSSSGPGSPSPVSTSVKNVDDDIGIRQRADEEDPQTPRQGQQQRSHPISHHKWSAEFVSQHQKHSPTALIEARLGLPPNFVDPKHVRIVEKYSGELLHEALRYSPDLFLLLEGDCECTIGGRKLLRERNKIVGNNSLGSNLSSSKGVNNSSFASASSDIKISGDFNGGNGESGGLGAEGPLSSRDPSSSSGEDSPRNTANYSGALPTEKEEAVDSNKDENEQQIQKPHENESKKTSKESLLTKPLPSYKPDTDTTPYEGGAYRVNVPGEFIGSYAVLAQIPHYTYCIAKSNKVRFLQVDRVEVERLLVSFPFELGLNLLQSLIPKVKNSMHRLEAAVEGKLLQGGDTLYKAGESSEQGFYLVSSGNYCC